MSNNKLFLTIIVALATSLVTTLPVWSAITMKPTAVEGLNYDGQMLSGPYRTDITKPEDILCMQVNITSQRFVDREHRLGRRNGEGSLWQGYALVEDTHRR